MTTKAVRSIHTAQSRQASRKTELRIACERKGGKRARITLRVMVLLGAALILRLGYLQLVRGPALAAQARAQHAEEIEIFGRRGTISDRDGNVLARSYPTVSVYVDPHLVTDKAGEAEKLSRLVNVSSAELQATFGADTHFRWIVRKINQDLAHRIAGLKLPGVELVPEDTGLRSDPAGKLASHVLGFVNIDETGLGGIEYEYNQFLRGESGKKSMEFGDGSGPIPFGKTSIEEPAKPGIGIKLTLDSDLQFTTQEALREGVRQFHAVSGSAIVMDPWTGEILALANVPDFDPNNFYQASADDQRDRAVTDAYEPGSTFKLITAAAALESGRADADARFPALDELTVGERTIHNAEDGMPAGGHGTESIEDIIAYSHNVGAAELGMRAGAHALYAMIRKFGFGDYTNIDLPGESDGIVPPTSDWYGSSVATISFGHGISTTPIALVRAYSAIANGGLLMRPRIVSEFRNADGSMLYRYPPEVERRVISERTAATLRRYLRAVVERGTGNPTARVPGFSSAGKTGTAQVVENGHYAMGQYNASFAGYVPADHPRFVIFVKVEKPRGLFYGSQVAAPIFVKIAREAMMNVGVMPHDNQTDLLRTP